jgi:hypothetical protein
MEMNSEAEQKTLHQMAKVYNFLEMWQGSQNLRATQMESRAQNKQISAIGYISYTEEIVKESWSLFQPDGVAAFKLSEESPAPPALSAKDLPGEQTQILNVPRIKQIDCHPAESDEDSSRESIPDTENWLNWNGALNIPNECEDDWEADNESNMELDNGSEDSETPEQQNISATPFVPGLIQPIRRTKKNVEQALMTVNIMETRRN